MHTASPNPQREKRYRFTAIADIHIDLENGGNNIYFIHAEKNLKRALQAAKERECSFIVSAGDQITNASGATAEWRRYRQIIEESGYHGHIFEAMGNHETRFAKYGGCTIEECHREFITYTRLAEKPVQRTEGKTYYVYIDDTFGDAFLFLSLENGVSTNETDNFTREQMDWAEALTAQYLRENRRIFLIQHAPVYGFGAGDDSNAPAYAGSMRMADIYGKPFANNQRFFNLIQTHKDIIWLSGHTHVDLRDKVNYSNDNGNACHMLHIPCLGGTTRLAYDGNGKRTLDRTFYEDAAQGYIADVYENRVTFHGINFYYDRLYPDCTYTIYR